MPAAVRLCGQWFRILLTMESRRQVCGQKDWSIVRAVSVIRLEMELALHCWD